MRHNFAYISNLKYFDMNKMKIFNLTVIVAMLFANMVYSQDVDQNKTYEANWESLAKYNTHPEWFKDAKFGIYFHWGPYSVPAYSTEWYPRFMYMPKRGNEWGNDVFAHHEKTYGKIGEFDYHDFIPMFKGENFDAKEWAILFKNAGAKFAGPVALHHDGFAMWDSELNPWNAAEMGPRKDITGELLAELKKNNLKTITTFHHARTLQRYTNDTANWADAGAKVSDNSHFPYHPDYVTSTTHPKLRKLYGNMPAKEFHEYWLGQVNEVVDKYAPDMLWFDCWMFAIPDEYKQKMVAHHYNTGLSRGQEPVVFYKHEDMNSEVGILDIEQGGKEDISEDFWLTDITLSHNGGWSYQTGQQYKKASLVIRNMIDVWSKNGVVLLNISPKANGIIPEEQRSVLNSIGEWIKKHEEAVYETRAHSIFGYGNAEFEKSHLGESQSAKIKYTKNDIRFTKSKDGKTLYIYLLGLPDANKKIEFKHIFETNSDQRISQVTIVGGKVKLKWKVNNSILSITTPSVSDMDEIATVFKVNFK